ncbi:MFS transporter [Ciceribacter naphthalenivorans]|uniref:MFS transporter n=3 Tax=Pseudomonadota TaxID=1224 RepID=A0A512HEZ7_9HYPH|nr:MFS transporter [Ciceribacter naphthalenivorans]GLR21090.1 MFS transporter [Ciceribacter naphthalenivorans]GLT03946.1 MFS transporter [Sphingomonas psychrolutea]
MAAAMGFGRFSFTPILPGMIADLGLSSTEAGVIAAANFTGYLAGAVVGAYGWANGRDRWLGLASLLFTALLMAGMGLTDSVAAFVVLRFLSGIASAFAMIFITSIVLGHAARAGNEAVQSAHFAGVGFGIAASSLMIMLVGLAGFGWRADWLAGAGVTFAVFLFVARFLPRAPVHAADVPHEPPIVWSPAVILTMLSYGLFGFGYVVTATFIVTMARMANAGPMVEFLTWFVTGCTAAASLFLWRPVMHRKGLGGAYLAGLLVEAAGVLASVALPSPAAPLVGGALLGATFMIITAYGLRLGRALSPQSPRRALAFMTAAFGIGQIVGPLCAGWLAERTGSFSAPSLVAAAVLLVSAGLILPVQRRLP